MFFTVLKFEVVDVVDYLKDYDKMHKFIQSMFNCQRSEANVLYHVSLNAGEILIKSDVKPEINTKKVVVLYQEEIDFDRWILNNAATIEIHATPCVTKSRMDYGLKNPKRVYLESDQEKIKWIRKRMEDNGCMLNCVHSIKTEEVDINKSGTKLRRLSIDKIVAKVKIIDKEKFVDMCKRGIGSNKAYGAGLVLPFVW